MSQLRCSKRMITCLNTAGFMCNAVRLMATVGEGALDSCDTGSRASRRFVVESRHEDACFEDGDISKQL